jgi:hypothetical protein
MPCAARISATTEEAAEEFQKDDLFYGRWMEPLAMTGPLG